MDSNGVDGKVADKTSLESSSVHGGSGGHHHPYNFRRIFQQVPGILLLFSTAFIACVVIYNRSAAYPLRFAFNTTSSSSTSLVEVLRKASMGNKTVILTTLNGAWAAPNSVFDLFLESFRNGNGTIKLLNHLVVITLDKKAYARCIKIHGHCYALTNSNNDDKNKTDFSREARFMTPDYLKMMWARINFLGSVLDLGYSFIFTDTDIMWFRNPFPRFYRNADFQIACDYFRGNPSDVRTNLPNGGFTYVKSNSKTSRFYKFWYNSRKKFPGLHDQDVLNKIKQDPYIKKIGLKIKFLDTAYFGGFCQPSKDLNKVCTMHANCCVGLQNKIYDLKIILEDWLNYTSSSASPNTTTSVSRTSPWHVPQHC